MELSEDESAAAKMAATTRPDSPDGMCFVMKSGKTRSPPAKGKVALAALAKAGSAAQRAASVGFTCAQAAAKSP